ncbi:MAG: universal stress protein [Fibrobacterales bacterium]
MNHYNTILYPINLDAPNKKMINEAINHAMRYDAALHILFVNNPQAGYRSPLEKEADVKRAVAHNVDSLDLDQLNITYAIAIGEVGSAVQDYVSKHPVDLIITGHTHHSALYSLFFDTADEKIIDAVNLPILVLPKE